MKKLIYESLKSKCLSDIAEAQMSLTLCFKNPVAIGEHTHEHFSEELIKALDKLTSAKDNLNTLEDFWKSLNSDSML